MVAYAGAYVLYVYNHQPFAMNTILQGRFNECIVTCNLYVNITSVTFSAI